MKEFSFYKMSGSGNDFILIDDRKKELSEKGLPLLAKRLCRRKLSIGADGLIVIWPSNKVDFKWHFYNADGSEAEMCGNGGRCVARLANLLGLSGEKVSFETKAGIIKAQVKGETVKLLLPPPMDLDLDLALCIENKDYKVYFINTGVPHTIIFVDRLEDVPIETLGRRIRFHSYFRPAGTNVDFVKIVSKNNIKIRTYERGVEGETLACGTGAVASTIIAIRLGLVKSPLKIETRSGEILEVYTDADFSKVFLKGKTRLVFKGKVYKEALKQ
jgi:diaminopimelate epimerase